MRIVCFAVFMGLLATEASGQSRSLDPDGERGKTLLAQYDAIREKYRELDTKRLEVEERREALEDYLKILDGSKPIADVGALVSFNRESIRLTAYRVELENYARMLLGRLMELSEALSQYLEEVVGYREI